MIDTPTESRAVKAFIALGLLLLCLVGLVLVLLGISYALVQLLGGPEEFRALFSISGRPHDPWYPYVCGVFPAVIVLVTFIALYTLLEWRLRQFRQSQSEGDDQV